MPHPSNCAPYYSCDDAPPAPVAGIHSEGHSRVKVAVCSNWFEGFVERPTGDRGHVGDTLIVPELSVLDRVDSGLAAWQAAPLGELAADGQRDIDNRGDFWRLVTPPRSRAIHNTVWAEKWTPWKAG